MNLTIELSDELGSALEAVAEAQGLSAGTYIANILQNTLAKKSLPESAGSPLETGYGMWARYGKSPSADEIDKNRRDMFQNFAKDLE